MVTLGVVHNPKSDKRTTKGVFHVVDDGLPISGDKKVVPLCVCVGVPGSVWSSASVMYVYLQDDVDARAHARRQMWIRKCTHKHTG